MTRIVNHQGPRWYTCSDGSRCTWQGCKAACRKLCTHEHTAVVAAWALDLKTRRRIYGEADVCWVCGGMVGRARIKGHAAVVRIDPSRELPTILVTSYSDATHAIRELDLDFVISINAPKGAPLCDPPSTFATCDVPEHQKLLLRFDDVSSSFHGGMVAPQVPDVEKVIALAGLMQPYHTVLIHCAAGKSRSTAAAVAIIASKLAPGGADFGDEVFDKLDKVIAHSVETGFRHPKDPVLPNERFVKIVGLLLSRRRELVGAWRKRFREREDE